MKSPAQFVSPRLPPDFANPRWVPLALPVRSGISPQTLEKLGVHARRGLTLIELMISTVISLSVMAATVALFGVVADKINNGRAMIETNDRLRSTEQRLLRDLSGLTLDAVPWGRPDSASGYLEIIKGATRDTYPSANGGYKTNPIVDTQFPNVYPYLLGYTQDVLFLTTRSKDIPFTGRYNGTTIESQVAEVVWFMYPTLNGFGNMTNPPTYTLYRRQLLVRPDLPPVTPSPSAPTFQSLIDNYDISTHPSPTNSSMFVPNSLADLTYRENRFCHNSTTYPYFVQGPLTSGQASTNYPNSNVPTPNPQTPVLQPFWPPPPNPNSTTPVFSGTPDPRYGDDVVLTNVLSFDIKVWDKLAEVRIDTNTPQPTPLVPSDPAWGSFPTPNTANPVFGAYVDLNYYQSTIPTGSSGNITYPSYFSAQYYNLGINSGLAMQSGTSPNAYMGLLAMNSPNSTTPNYSTYDTWSLGYEYAKGTNPSAAANNYAAPGPGSGPATDGFDDFPKGTNINTTDGGVDSPSQRQTSPPYPVPLRGIQIKIRVYEPSSRQVREVTVAQSFLPD